jgi:hypothetical protein
MSYTKPYPSAEHYEAPTSSADVLAEELHYYSTPHDFAANITALQTYVYEGKPLLTGLRKFARLLQMGRIAAGTPQPYEPPTLAKTFYDGEVMGMHVALDVHHEQCVQKALQCDPLKPWNEDSAAFAISPKLQETARHLQRFREGTWKTYLARHHETYQSKILKAASLMCDGTVHTDQKKDDFVAGYLFASQTIVMKLNAGD